MKIITHTRRQFLTTTILALAAGFCPAQTPKLAESLDGFIGIKWGASTEDARHVTDDRGLQFMRMLDGGTHMYLEGGKFGEWKAKRWNLLFVGGKFFSGRVMVVPEGKRDRAFTEVKRVLSAKYGAPKKTERRGNDRAVWIFPATAARPAEEVLELSDDPSEPGPRISYTNETLNKAGGARPAGKPEKDI